MKKFVVVLYFLGSVSFGITQSSGQVTDTPSLESLPQQKLQNAKELQEQTGAIRIGTESTSEQVLDYFYFNTQSFVKVLQAEKRVAGGSWAVQQSDYSEWKNAIDKATKRRLELAKESKSLDRLSDEFWAKVFDAEITAEKDLGEMLQSVLPPNELDNFLVEHAKELGTSILTSPIFRDRASLDSKQYDALVRVKKDHFAITVRIGSEKSVLPARLQAMRREFVLPLTAEQFGVYMELTGRKDPSISLEEHMTSRIDATQRGYLIDAIPGLRKYVKTSATK